jgi:hypothetical protein
MKANLKFILALACFYFIANATFAQPAKKNEKTPMVQSEQTIPKGQTNAPFLGIWELYKVASNGRPLQDYPPGYIKIYNADGTFSIIRVQNTGSIIKGSGHYIIDNDQTCREADKAEDLIDKGFKIKYEFSPDKNVLSISFSFEDGIVYTEAYRKLQPKA